VIHLPQHRAVGAPVDAQLVHVVGDHLHAPVAVQVGGDGRGGEAGAVELAGRRPALAAVALQHPQAGAVDADDLRHPVAVHVGQRLQRTPRVGRGHRPFHLAVVLQRPGRPVLLGEQQLGEQIVVQLADGDPRGR
jgi:hypothetical protein